MTLVEKFVAVHMAKQHPKQIFEVREDGLGHCAVIFQGRDPYLLHLPHRRPWTTQEVSLYLSEIAQAIDDFLVDPLPWQLWSAYV